MKFLTMSIEDDFNLRLNELTSSGFAPATFSSSKSKRQTVNSGPVDKYMDDEDISGDYCQFLINSK